MANYTYTYTKSSNKFGQVIIGRSFTHTEPVSLSANDTITINFGSGFSSSDSVAMVPNISGEFTGTLSGMNTTGDPYTLTYVGDYGTSGNEAVLTMSSINPFFSAPAVRYKNNADSSPTVSDIEASTNSTSTSVDKSFTVTGLATGKKCGFYALGNGRIKRNSGSFAQSVVGFENNDTVTVRQTSPDTKGVTRVYTFYSFDGRGSSVRDQEGEYEITVNADTDNIYGMEFFDSAGDSILSINDRSSRFVSKGSYTVTNQASNSTHTKTISLTGMDTTDKWIISAHIDLEAVTTTQYIAVQSITQGTDEITIVTSNATNSAQTYDVEYYVLITG